MNVLLWFLLTSAVFIGQTQFAVLNRPLNLSAALVFFYSLSHAKPHVKGYWSGRGDIHAALFGALIGIIEDGLAGSIIGPSMMSKSLAGIVSVFIFSDVFFKYTTLLGASILALITAADYLIMTGIRYILTDISLNPLILLETVLIQSLVNLLLGILILRFTKVEPL